MKVRNCYGTPAARSRANAAHTKRLTESGGCRVTIRLPGELAARLDELAAAAGVSRNRMAANLLEGSINSYNQ